MDPVERRRQQAEHLLRIGRPGDAAAACSEALASAPDRTELLVLRARIHLEVGEHTQARDTAERAVALDAGPAAMHVLAIALRLLGNHDRSEELLDAAIRQRPESPALHLGRALTIIDEQLRLRAGAAPQAVDLMRVGDAEASATHAASLDPEAARPHFVLGLCARARGDEPAAAGHLLEALTRDPGWAEAHLLLGHIRASQGMSRMASRHYASAGALDPSEGRALKSLRDLVRIRAGWLARRLGRTPRPLRPVRVVPEAEQVLAIDRDLGGGT